MSIWPISKLSRSSSELFGQRQILAISGGNADARRQIGREDRWFRNSAWRRRTACRRGLDPASAGVRFAFGQNRRGRIVAWQRLDNLPLTGLRLQRPRDLLAELAQAIAAAALARRRRRNHHAFARKMAREQPKSNRSAQNHNRKSRTLQNVAPRPGRKFGPKDANLRLSAVSKTRNLPQKPPRETKFAFDDQASTATRENQSKQDRRRRQK